MGGKESMKTQPPGLQTDLLQCSRETRDWILCLSNALDAAEKRAEKAEAELDKLRLAVDPGRR